MNTILKKNTNIETQEEIDLILERLEEAKSGQVKTIDDAMKDYINEREVWKTLA